MDVITTGPPLDNTRTTEEHSIITTEEDSVTTEQAIVTIEASLQSSSNLAPNMSESQILKEIIAKETRKNFLLAQLAKQ